jgi:catechol 2,3-dioxygenase-like lactoylglutathione lyase family enzyme
MLAVRMGAAYSLSCGRGGRMMRHGKTTTRSKIPDQNSRGFQVKLSLKNTVRAMVVFSSMLLIFVSITSAQTPPTSWATLDAPPTGTVPPGDVLRAGHLGREIADAEDISHFYHDLIGLEIRGTRDQPRPFSQHHGLQEFVDIGQGVSNPYDSMSRVVLLPIPGSATAPGGPEMTIEAIEIRGIKSAPFHVALRDPGASYLTIFVRDIDKTLALLTAERYPVITVGGNPVELASWPGLTGKIRAVFVRDPDGTPVELVELSPAPASTAAADSKVLGARVTIVVNDLEKTCRLYQSLVGPDFKFWVSPSWIDDKAYDQLTGEAGPFRMAQAIVPGSPVVMQLVEYKTHNRKPKIQYIQDPGTAHFLFMSKDDDVEIQRVHAAGIHTLSKSDVPVFIGPTTRSFFIRDPQSFFLEFMDNNVKRDPTAK